MKVKRGYIVLNAAVPVEVVEKIDLIAENEGFYNRSHIIRQALDEYIKKREVPA
jgi:metal-responsive CopG/Arc/MetJ family transcriptional regulator